MKKFLAQFLLLGAAAILTCGCGGGAADNSGNTISGDAPKLVQAAYAGKKICLACGEAFAKGEEHTCRTDGERCSHCDRIKGSPLCCVDIKVDNPEGKALCGSCGEIAGTDSCCKEGAEKCEKCGLHEGAPGCCNLAHKHEH